jgi:hypothetical protein
MNHTIWNDTKCSLCGGLAHYRSQMYLQHKPVPGLEFLCRTCKEAIELPANTIVLPTNCAAPDERQHTINGRFHLLGDSGEIVETHYLCAEHAWRWRQELGPEFEMSAQSISFTGHEQGTMRRFLRDDMRGAFLGDESQEVT